MEMTADFESTDDIALADRMKIGRQQIIAGHFPNSRPALTAWISRPQSLLPGDAMPDTGLTPEQAGAVADYLYTLDR